MKRNARQTGGRDRLRFSLLLASVAAFLFVPAAVASAANDVHVTFEGNGSGTVKSIEGEPAAGTPPLDCHWNGSTINIGTPEAGKCENEHGLLAGILPAIALEQEADSGSEFVEWIIEEGEEAGADCAPGETECHVLLDGYSQIKVKAVFVKQPNVHIHIEGAGSGRVFGVSPSPGEPPVDCEWDGSTQTGDCDVVATKSEPAAPYSISVNHEQLGGSAFGGWHVVEGSHSAFLCKEDTPGSGTCSVTLLGSEIDIIATFTPPPVPLTINTGGGSGSGQVNCKVDGGSTDSPCKTEYAQGTELELIPAADTGSEFGGFENGTGSAASCSGTSPCTITLSEASTLDAPFALEAESFSVSQTGEGTVECEDATAGGGFGACATSYPYGHTIKVAAAPIGENVIASLTGSGSAEGEPCASEATNGSCEFAITEPSGVEAIFAAGNTIAQQEENVHGEVPQTTELATTCENDVDLGEFIPGEAANYIETCGLTVTATGSENTLTAADETGVDTGYLTQKPTHPYSLPQALETKATGIPSLEYPGTGGGTFAPLTSPVTLLSYGGPVSADNVTLTFRQKIGLHDALHTGVYSKTITLTLKQTAL